MGPLAWRLVPQVWSAPVRFVECDQQGVVFNAHYLIWADEAVNAWWAARGLPWQALVDRGVVPDFRTPDRVRLGPAPLYTRFVDVWDAMACFREVLASGAHMGYPTVRARVT